MTRAQPRQIRASPRPLLAVSRYCGARLASGWFECFWLRELMGITGDMLVTCPSTNQRFSTGIHTDAKSLQACWKKVRPTCKVRWMIVRCAGPLDVSLRLIPASSGE
jgi:hypothetical protein